MLSATPGLFRRTLSHRAAAFGVGLASLFLLMCGLRVAWGEAPAKGANESRAAQAVVPAETKTAEKPKEADTRAKERNAEVDAAIQRLREDGAFVREFHPRTSPEYWVQIITTDTFNSDVKRVVPFKDEDLADVERVARGRKLDLHLRDTQVTAAGLQKLSTVGAISTLDLDGGTVDAQLLEVLPKLPLTGELALNSSLVQDADIRSVAKCQHLQSLTLMGKHLTNDCLTHLVDLPDLTGIRLGETFTLQAFSTLGRLRKNLRTLDLPDKLAPQLRDFMQVPNLQKLALSGTELTDESARDIAATFHSLEQAYLRQTAITNVGFEHLSKLQTLHTLTLDGCQVDDGIAPSIRHMKQLKWISLEGCDVGDATLAAISECPDVWYIMLSNTRITDEGLVSLSKTKNLHMLYLSNCKLVTNTGIDALTQIGNPRAQINIQRTSIDEAAARRLQGALPQARIVWGVPAVSLK